MNKIKILLPIILIIIIMEVIITTMNKENENNNLKIHFFNAGKADAIVISINNQYMMIDTGEEELSGEILNYFKNNKITKLDYLIITHFDKDHVGSASKIIDNIEIGEVLQSNFIKESEYYTKYINSMNNKNITPKTISNDYNFNLSDLTIIVNGPEEIYDDNESNNSSLIVSIIYNNNKFLFMGDAQNARIKDFLQDNDETYDFLKVPYHGHYLKRLNDLLVSKKIKYAVITSSNKEKEDDRTIEMLNDNNIKYYLTRNGSINVLSDGNNIIIN